MKSKLTKGFIDHSVTCNGMMVVMIVHANASNIVFKIPKFLIQSKFLNGSIGNRYKTNKTTAMARLVKTKFSWK
jgi:hypothetical protein